jgi:hypothetical protein
MEPPRAEGTDAPVEDDSASAKSARMPSPLKPVGGKRPGLSRVSRGRAGRTGGCAGGRLRRTSAACASPTDTCFTASSPGHDTPPPLPSRQAPAAPPPVRHDTPPLVPSRKAPAASAKSARIPSPSKSVGGERGQVLAKQARQWRMRRAHGENAPKGAPPCGRRDAWAPPCGPAAGPTLRRSG